MKILPIDFSQAMAKNYIMALSPESIMYINLDSPTNETPVGSTETDLKETTVPSTRVEADMDRLGVNGNLSPEISHDTSPGFSAYQEARGIFSESLYTSVVTKVEKLLEPRAGKMFDFKEPTLYQIINHEDRFEYPEKYYASIRAKIKELQEPGEGAIFDIKKPTYFQIKGFEDKINNPFLAEKPRPEAEKPRPKVEAHLTPKQILAYLMLRDDNMAMSEADRQECLLSDHRLFEEILKMRRLGNALPQQERVQKLAVAA